MSTPILATKLYIPPMRPNVVLRPRLLNRLNEGLHRKLTLISAPAGFGKTTLLSEWVHQQDGQSSIEGQRIRDEIHPSQIAWLSLDEGDKDPTRFLTYIVAALQTLVPNLGDDVLAALQSPQPPPAEAILTSLLNAISSIPDRFALVLDDYHVIDAQAVDDALTFLLNHLPPPMHLVIATREDPQLPLARLRARGQLTELRASNLRFTAPEAAEFLNQAMGLNLSAEDIDALENRTEGWIAGLQLAALALQGPISMPGQQDATNFIQSFTGSHRFVMDYLVEEVLHQQPEHVQTFLLQTSVLDRLCGQLCDAVIGKDEGRRLKDESSSSSFSPHPSSLILEYLERANLFIIPLDSERRWYRYHHLFADLLRQRLYQSFSSSPEDVQSHISELHVRASQWYEDNGLAMEAFNHAAAANDIDRAGRLIGSEGIPLHLRGAVVAILEWLESLPTDALDARPWLYWRHASLLLVNGHTTGVEEKLDAAEAALQGNEADDRILIGRIAAARSVLALTRYQADNMLAQSRRTLELLPPDYRSLRATAYWTMGYAYFLQGDRQAARHAQSEAIALSEAAEDTFLTILATLGLGNVEEAENQLHQAAETYRRVLQIAGNQPLQIIYDAHLGLARILYEWNDLDAAEQHGEQSLHLARQYDKVIDRFIVCEVFTARLKLARGDVDGAAAILVQAERAARQKNFVYRIPEVAAAQVLVLLHQGQVAVAGELAQTHELPISQARVFLAQGKATAALAILEPLRQQMEARNWQDERLKLLVLQAVAHHAQNETDKALQMLHEALTLAEPGGFTRLFVDEGRPMAELLERMGNLRLHDEGRRMKDYIHKLLSIFDEQMLIHPSSFILQPLEEPLSERELEVLQLVAQGFSNREIGEQLFLAIDTVKGHNRRIYGKLQVQRRTEAVARARELGLL